MIDRTARDKLALLLEDVSTGRISEDEFLRGLPMDSRDRAVVEIADQPYWISPELSQEDCRGDIDTWVLFLRTDLQYEWPSLPTETGWWKPMAVSALTALLLGAPALLISRSRNVALLCAILGILVAGIWFVVRTGQRRIAYDRAGDNDVRPFTCRSDYEEALGTRTA